MKLSDCSEIQILTLEVFEEANGLALNEEGLPTGAHDLNCGNLASTVAIEIEIPLGKLSKGHCLGTDELVLVFAVLVDKLQSEPPK